MAAASVTNPVSLEIKADDAGGAIPAAVAAGWRAPAKPEATWEENLVLIAGETAVALPPGDAGSHVGRNDTMQGMDAPVTAP